MVGASRPRAGQVLGRDSDPTDVNQCAVESDTLEFERLRSFCRVEEFPSTYQLHWLVWIYLSIERHDCLYPMGFLARWVIIELI